MAVHSQRLVERGFRERSTFFRFIFQLDCSNYCTEDGSVENFMPVSVKGNGARTELEDGGYGGSLQNLKQRGLTD